MEGLVQISEKDDSQSFRPSCTGIPSSITAGSHAMFILHLQLSSKSIIKVVLLILITPRFNITKMLREIEIRSTNVAFC